MKQLQNHFYLLLAVLCILLLWSCSRDNSLEESLADYRKRIARLTEVEGDEVFHSQLKPYPRRREMLQPLAAVRIGLLDFFSLDDCDLQVLVAERNNAMGRVMSTDRLLVYEHTFLVKLEDCLRKLQTEVAENDSWLQQLAEINKIKKDNLKGVLWNATFASPQFERLFSLSVQPPEIAGFAASGAEVNASLIFLQEVSRHIGKPELQLSPLTLSQQYATFENNAYGGALLLAMEQLTFYLNNVADLLEKRMAKRPLCVDGKPGQTAGYLKNVFDKFYRDGIQIYLATTHKQGREFLQNISQLAELHPFADTPAFAEFYHAQIDMRNPDGLWQRFDSAIKRHTAAWQTLFDHCGMMPQ